jgi:hypothetical protein
MPNILMGKDTELSILSHDGGAHYSSARLAIVGVRLEARAFWNIYA